MALYRAVGRSGAAQQLEFSGGVASGWSLYVTSNYTSYVIDRSFVTIIMKGTKVQTLGANAVAGVWLAG